MLIDITAKEVLEVRKKENCSIEQAFKTIRMRKSLKAINEAGSIEDIKYILKYILRNML